MSRATPTNRMARFEATEAQLRAAFLHGRKPGWPEAFEVARTVPIIAAQLRLQAYLDFLNEAKRQMRLAQVPTVRCRVLPVPPTPRAVRLPALDFKRRAAGERDDD